MDFEQFDSVIKDTCINYGVPRSDLNGATSAFSDFVEEHAEAKALDTSVFYVVMLAAAYKAGRESAAH
jgi:hypothetical protein